MLPFPTHQSPCLSCRLTTPCTMGTQAPLWHSPAWHPQAVHPSPTGWWGMMGVSTPNKGQSMGKLPTSLSRCPRPRAGSTARLPTASVWIAVPASCCSQVSLGQGLQPCPGGGQGRGTAEPGHCPVQDRSKGCRRPFSPLAQQKPDPASLTHTQRSCPWQPPAFWLVASSPLQSLAPGC